MIPQAICEPSLLSALAPPSSATSADFTASPAEDPTGAAASGSSARKNRLQRSLDKVRSERDQLCDGACLAEQSLARLEKKNQALVHEISAMKTHAMPAADRSRLATIDVLQDRVKAAKTERNRVAQELADYKTLGTVDEILDRVKHTEAIASFAFALFGVSDAYIGQYRAIIGPLQLELEQRTKGLSAIFELMLPPSTRSEVLKTDTLRQIIPSVYDLVAASAQYIDPVSVAQTTTQDREPASASSVVALFQPKPLDQNLLESLETCMRAIDPKLANLVVESTDGKGIYEMLARTFDPPLSSSVPAALGGDASLVSTPSAHNPVRDRACSFTRQQKHKRGSRDDVDNENQESKSPDAESHAISDQEE